jgi:hypothetical protein
MFAIEFQAQIRDGVIEIPAKQREELLAQINGGEVRVIVLAPAVRSPTKAIKEPSFLQYLLENPLYIPDFEPMTREEIYDPKIDRDR